MAQAHPSLRSSKAEAVQSNTLSVHRPNLAEMRLSENVFYGVFLFIGLIMTGLLYGISVREMAVGSPVLPDRHARLEEKMRGLVKGYPIDEMTTLISRENKTTAAFLIGIAKKESNWGKRVPRSDDGADCFNYWGYRGEGSRGIAMGHGCFGSREEAVAVVGKRLQTLVAEYEFDTPEELIVWKCGWSCDGHSNESVKKWIADVDLYFRKVNN